ncbi:MAG: glycosyltransferase family 4 protein [Akkermansiaceae bacterium]
MKVIQILPELESGGVERGTLEVGKYLTEQGHESVVISNGGRLVYQLEAEGSRHITVPVHRKKLSSLKQVKVLRELFEEEKPDIIHLRSRLPAWLAWLAWRKMNPKTRPRLITTVHGFYSVNFYSKIMTRGEAVICVSNSVKDYVLKNYPDVPEDRLTVIHRGVDSGEFPYGYQPPADWLAKWQADYPQLAGKYVVTLPGRITRWKGHLDFVEVIAGLREKGIPAHGLIAGGPHPKKLDFHEEVKQAIKIAGLTDDITLIGHRNDLREVMAVSDVVVSLSTDPEAFGRVSLEALCLDIPVAAYAHGGVKEQLQTLFPEGAVEVNNHHEIILRIISWHDKRPKIISNEAFSLESMCSSIILVYKSMINSSNI